MHGSRWRREETAPVGYAAQRERLPPTLPPSRSTLAWRLLWIGGRLSAPQKLHRDVHRGPLSGVLVRVRAFRLFVGRVI